MCSEPGRALSRQLGGHFWGGAGAARQKGAWEEVSLSPGDSRGGSWDGSTRWKRGSCSSDTGERQEGGPPQETGLREGLGCAQTLGGHQLWTRKTVVTGVFWKAAMAGQFLKTF